MRQIRKTMVTKLSDLASSVEQSTTDNDSDAGSASSTSDSLRETCEEIGADYEHAQDYVDVHGGKDDLIEFAERVAEDDELVEQMERYRRWNDQHRIRRRHLHNVDGSFEAWTTQFYGDTDDPEPETYNGVQKASRAMDGNLIYYRALFPEPQEQYWNGEAVLWEDMGELGHKDDEQDSHIYVDEDFVEEYSSFTVDVNGEAKPRPPTDEEIQRMQGGRDADAAASSSNDTQSGLPFDPADYTVDGLRDKLTAKPGDHYTVEEIE